MNLLTCGGILLHGILEQCLSIQIIIQQQAAQLLQRKEKWKETTLIVLVASFLAVNTKLNFKLSARHQLAHLIPDVDQFSQASTSESEPDLPFH